MITSTAVLIDSVQVRDGEKQVEHLQSVKGKFEILENFSVLRILADRFVEK